jgi:hypothetical protein
MLQPNTKIPQIDLSAAPKEESDDLWLLNHALNEIQQQTENFLAAVHLFDYCHMQISVLPGRTSDAFSSWLFVAARDAVMSVWHFRQQIAAANTLANRSAYVEPSLDKSSLKESHSKFDQYFPDFAAIRHAVAHAGELARNKDIYEQNAFSGTYTGPAIRAEGSGLMIQGNLQNRIYTCTFQGKVVHCDISGTSIVRLREVASLFYRAFTNGPTKEAPPTGEG